MSELLIWQRGGKGSLLDHDREYVDAHEEEEEDGEEDEADEVEPGEGLVLAVDLGLRGGGRVDPGAGGGGRGHDDVGGALLQRVNLQAEEDDGVLEEGAEHEEDARDDPRLRIMIITLGISTYFHILCTLSQPITAEHQFYHFGVPMYGT